MEDCWRIVAPDRARVPVTTTADPPLPAPPGPCPFCPEHQDAAGETLRQWPAQGRWEIKAVRNLYPHVSTSLIPPDIDGGHARPATGTHEVLVEGTAHDGDIDQWAEPMRSSVLRAYRDRLQDLEAMDGIRQIAMFRNRGRRAGSSQPHPHGQLVATTVAGRLHERRWTVARNHARREGRSLLDTVLARELDAEERIVSAHEDFVVLCPFAPQVSYETWIVPRLQRGSFSTLDDASVARFGELLADTLRRVREASGREAYNLIWRLPPVRTREDPAAFWFASLLPRGGPIAGLELSSGFTMCAVSPETAAAALRRTK